jgi:hypothetical protein
MRETLLVLLFSFLAVGCAGSHSPGAVVDVHAPREKIANSLPPGWRIAQPSDGQRRFDSLFSRATTDAFTLVGPGRNAINWVDRDGKQHQEMLAAECIFVWLVPTSFRPTWPLIDMSGARWPERLGDANGIAAYGLSDQEITDPARMQQITNGATEISSPSVQVSWLDWKRDIAAALRR